MTIRLTAMQMGAQLFCLSIVLAICEIAMSQTAERSQPPSEAPEIGVRAMIFSPDGSTLAIVRGHLRLQRYLYNDGSDRRVGFRTSHSELELWSVVENKLILKLTEFGGPILLGAFSPDGESLATVSWEALPPKPGSKRLESYKTMGVLKLWDAKTGALKWSREAHGRGVSALTFQADSKRLISAGASYVYELKVWDSQSGDEIQKIEYRAHVAALGVSDDGNTLAVTKRIFREARNEIKVYDARTFKEQMTLKSENRRAIIELAAPCAFSSDGTILAIGRSGVDRRESYSEVELWNLRTRKPIRLLTFDRRPVLQEDVRALTRERRSLAVTSLVFSPQGSRLTAANGVTVLVWEVATGEPILNGVSRTPSIVTASALTPLGDVLAVADTDNRVSLLNVNTGEVRSVLALSEALGMIDTSSLVVTVETIRSVAVYPDSQVIASAGSDSLVRLWEAKSGIEKFTLRGHEGDVLSVAVSRDSSTLVSGGEDGTIKVWRAQTGNLVRTIASSGARVNAVAVSPDGRLVASGSDDLLVTLWDAGTGQPRLTLKGHTAPVTAVAFSQDGTLLASASTDRTVRLWDVKSGEDMRALQGNLAPVTAIAFSQGTRLITGSMDGTVKVWDARMGQVIETFNGHQGQVNSVACSPDGRIIASGGDDKTVTLWDAQTGKSKRKLEGHGAEVYCVAFSPDGTTLVVGTGNNTLVLWDPRSGALNRVIRDSRKIPVKKL